MKKIVLRDGMKKKTENLQKQEDSRLNLYDSPLKRIFPCSNEYCVGAGDE